MFQVYQTLNFALIHFPIETVFVLNAHFSLRTIGPWWGQSSPIRRAAWTVLSQVAKQVSRQQIDTWGRGDPVWWQGDVQRGEM